MANPTFAAIDVGTTKVCTVVAEVTSAGDLRILGVGVGPSAGLTKGMVDNIHAAIEAIASSVERAERASGTRILSAHVGIAGPHVSSMNSRGIVAIADPRHPITESDVHRALESARIVNVPNNREVIHVVPRYYVVDGQDHVVDPMGMFGSRLDVETHVVTAGSSAMHNLMQCVEGAGVRVDSIILEPLASAEAVVDEEELNQGAVICDIGGGTTDIAVFVQGAVVHTAVLPVGGAHMTRDLVVALRVPQPAAELAKRRYGHAIPSLVDEDEEVEVDAFGSEGRKSVSRRLIAEVLQARTEELFEMVQAEIRRGVDQDVLSAGIVLTGGAASLPGIEMLAEDVLGLPARVGRPRHLQGLSDLLNDPAYATSVGLLRWSLKEREIMLRSSPGVPTASFGGLLRKVANLMRVVLPQ
ncbi:MAG: cell division protein FtsA [Dehalococcoidia bacterium]|nr:cell division protein FtsA [Dehalococcoidia bacterium]HRC61619.1 cell division protein FtsA [Dehalococcoidia bacterium]